MLLSRTISGLVRRTIPDRLKYNQTLRRYLVPEEVVLAKDAMREVTTTESSDSKTKVMVDVGAHFGSTSLPFLRAGWRVFAFEPDPANRARFLRATAYVGPEFLTLESCAVSEISEASVPFFASPVSTGISGLHAFHASHREISRVRTVSLADYCRVQEITQIDFLKIDVEGFDFPVLKGMNWQAIKPRAIVCEFDDSRSIPLGYSYGDVCDYLQDRGYTVLVSEWYSGAEYGRPHRWRRLAQAPCKLVDSKACGNLIAFTNPAHAKAALSRIKSLAATWRLCSHLRFVTGI